jgi:serine phosphatase RsbU (regulator of sigma subunit)
MDSTQVEERRTPSFQPAAVVDPALASSIPLRRAQELLREIADHLPPRPGNGRDGEALLSVLVDRMPVALAALTLAHEEQVRRLAERTGELSDARAVLDKQASQIAQATRRLAVEHAVARILARSMRLADAAPQILQAVSQGLGWDVGLLWTLKGDAEVLACMEVWHAPTVAIPAFEQLSRQLSFALGVGLPGRVWASDSPIWIADVSEDANLPRAPIAVQEGLHAAVAFPIRNGVEFLGVMEFFSLAIRQPDDELLQMMISIGSHISQFIERMKAEKGLIRKEAELGVAKKIQQGLVPKAAPALTGFDIAGASHCAVETGGDYFDFVSLFDSCQGIAIADASGHGLGPALLVTETRAYLRAFALTSEDIGRIVGLVNRRLVDDVGESYFVTLFLARLDPNTRSLVYTSAGHPSGYILDSSGSVRGLLESTGLPLGVLPDADFPVSAEIALQPGDLVLLLTDGVMEARAPDETAFGFQRALDIVRVYRGDTAAQIVSNLYYAIRAFSQYAAQVDDISAVVIKVREASGPSPPAPVFRGEGKGGEGPPTAQAESAPGRGALPRKALTGAVTQVRKRYQGLKHRYGPRYTSAMMCAAFLGLFSPLPGSILMGVALVVVTAEAHRAISKQGGLPEAVAALIVVMKASLPFWATGRWPSSRS